LKKYEVMAVAASTTPWFTDGPLFLDLKKALESMEVVGGLSQLECRPPLIICPQILSCMVVKLVPCFVVNLSTIFCTSWSFVACDSLLFHTP